MLDPDRAEGKGPSFKFYIQSPAFIVSLQHLCSHASPVHFEISTTTE